MTALKILVADVDLATHRAVENALAGKGYELAYATDGEQAFASAMRVKPDVLIIEPNLGVLDGLTLVRTIRSKPEYSMIPAIFLADKETVEHRIAGFKIGADDFLPKPLDADHLGQRQSGRASWRDRG